MISFTAWRGQNRIELGTGDWGLGIGEEVREQGAGSREQGAGSREQGSREQGAGSKGAGSKGEEFSPLPPAPRPSASFQCPMPLKSAEWGISLLYSGLGNGSTPHYR
ncbi:MAG: hypothetical protein V7K67_15785 [Nostoc sp.]